MESKLGTKGRKWRQRYSRKNHYTLTRRSFVAGMATLPFVGMAHAESSLAGSIGAEVAEAGLLFHLSEDQMRVTVTLMTYQLKETGTLIQHTDQGQELGSTLPKVDKTAPPVIGGTWDIHAQAFGPKAWFDIDIDQLNQSAAQRRNLLVRNASFGPYGENGSFWFLMRFQKTAGTSWDVTAQTNLLGSGSKTASSASLPLYDLVVRAMEQDESRKRPPFSFPAKPDAFSKILHMMTDGHVEKAENVTVSVSPSFLWSIGGTFTASHGSFTADGVQFQWLEDTTRASRERRFFLWSEKAQVQALAYGDRTVSPEFTMQGREDDPRGTGAFYCYAIETTPEIAPLFGKMVSFVSIKRLTLETALPGETALSSISLHDVVAGKILLKLGKKPVWRTSFWADAAEPVWVETVEKPDAEKKRSDPQPLKTPVGWMQIVRLEAQVEQQAPEPKKALPLVDDPKAPAQPLQALKLFADLWPAVLGDRSPIKARTFHALADDQNKLRRFSADLALLELDASLPDVSHSVLLFDHGHIRHFFTDGQELEGLPNGELAIPDAASHLWLGPTDGRAVLASIDLVRATLDARRQEDLVDLRFCFADLVLVFANDSLELRPRTPECRVIEAENGAVFDNRPLLNVEFGPQHVMEEAFFLRDPPPLPDVLYPQLEADLAKLAIEKEIKKRIDLRHDVQKQMSAKAGDQEFAVFAEEFGKTFGLFSNVPADQRIYIGPRFMEPDAMRMARQVQQEEADEPLREQIDYLLNVVAASYFKLEPHPAGPRYTMADLLACERQLENLLPLYMLWRDIYREIAIAESEDAAADYFHRENKPTPLTDELIASGAVAVVPPAQKQTLEAKAKEAMREIMAGQEQPKGLAMARLSGGSRLAFRINCAPTEGDAANVNGFPDLSPMDHGAGGMSFASLPFSFEALTDWSHHEPAVTRRAQKNYKSAPSGLLPPVGERAANLDDRAMLEFQGVAPGEKSSMDRMAEVRASLQIQPDAFETAIEIPARLILSTAQDAVWQTKRALVHPLLEGEIVDPVGGHPLWAARLLTRDVFPSVRAVASKDFRPSALMPRRGLKPDGAIATEAAPPRGPYAPWMLSRAEGQGNRDDCKLVAADNKNPDEKDWKIKYGKRGFVQWLCNALMINPEQVDDVNFQAALRKLKMFRTSLDAYDRHELVMLTSAYGLPVTGKREQIGNKEEEGGALKENSGQFEPGTAFSLYDVRPDQAVYRPKPLDIEELSLTALGGSLVHDTSFAPPLTAFDFEGHSVFDGLSIERWQHHTVLGRDILATVVYAGYLFPLGHKASLVKVTERIFIKIEGEGIKARLRQRMFVRVSNPVKQYPAVGQPNGGRQWCSSIVTMLTRQTPDIVDPTFDITGFGHDTSDAPDVAANGRINLKKETGLAFWPQTALDPDSRVKFEFLLDGRPTRMPLIFVDRVGIRAEPLQHVVSYYSKLDVEPMRNMALSDQSLRFADARAEGDTSFATRTIVVGVDGRSKGDDDSWQGDTGSLVTTGVLEGADQPPFYPSVERAEIRIEQVEQLSGGVVSPAWIKFDGHYVRHGFASIGSPDEKANAKASENAAEVFLVIDEADVDKLPRLDMGQNGNQSGGVAQPNLSVVGLSRLRGPLGASPAGGTLGLNIYQLGPSGNDDAPFTPGDPADANAHKQLRSIAPYFAMGTKAPTTAVQNPEDDAPNEMQVKLIETTYESFFSEQARLLGVITFKQLISILKLAAKGLAATSSMPLLQEAVDYGVAAAEKAENFIKDKVLVPLKELVIAVRKQWQQLDSMTNLDAINALLQDKLDEQISPLSKLFPEIETGLAEIEGLINATLAEEDEFAFVRHLGKLHSAVRRFIKLLAALARNAPERVGQEVMAKLTPSIGKVQQIYSELTGFVAGLEKNAEFFVDQLFNHLTDEVIGWIIGSDLPIADILVLLDKVNGLSDDTALVEKVLATLKPKNWDAKAKGALNSAISEPAESEKKLTDLLKALLDDGIFGAVAAVELVKTEKATVETKNALFVLLHDYRAQLDAWKDELGSKTLSPELNHAIARLVTLSAIVGAASDLRNADDLIKVAATLAFKHFGHQLKQNAQQALEERIRDVLKSAIPAEPLVNAPENLPEMIAQCLNNNDITISNSKGHWLEDFASAVNDGNKVDEKLKTANKEINDALNDNTVPEAAKNVLRSAKTHMATYGDVIKNFHELFCASAGGLQKMRELQTQIEAFSDADDLSAHVKLIARTARELAQIAERCGVLLTAILTDLSGEGDTLLFGLLAAAVGKILKDSSLPKMLLTAAEDARDEAEKLDGKLAEILRQSWNFVVRIENQVKDAVGSIAPNLASLTNALNAVPQVMNPERDQLVIEIGKFIDAIRQFGRPILQEISLPAPIAMKDLLKEKLTEQITVKSLIDSLATGKTWDDVLELRKLHLAQKAVAAAATALLARITGMPGELANNLVGVAAKTVAAQLVRLQGELITARNDVYNGLGKIKALQELLIVKRDNPLAGEPTIENDKFVEEKELLETIVALGNGADPRSDIFAYVTAVDNGKLAVLQVLAQAEDLARKIVRGEVLSLVDIAALRDDMEDLIADMLPVRRRFSYDLGFDFDAGKIGKATGRIFVPKPPGRFDLKMNASYDLLKGTADMTAKGHIGAFDINLIGNIFQAVTLKFDGMDFSFEAGGAPRFDVHYNDFVIGNKLQFVQKLQQMLKPPKDGNGFFIQAMKSVPGIEAGYGLNLGTLQLGGMAFSNISLNASAGLPFDGSEALFKFSLGRPAAPFLVSVPPFGGGAHVAIIANADGFKGFEASIEFGGVADFSTGPLVAAGRISAGFYISSLRVEINGKTVTITRIGGTFYCGGEASIWIFSFHASLYVTFIMDSASGEMTGTAIFTFSFSLGIVDYDYRVAFTRKQKAIGGGSGGGAKSDTQALSAFAKSQALTADDNDGKGPFNAGRLTVCQTKDIYKFLNYYDMELV